MVQEFFEKVDNPPSDLANAAVYIFEDAVGEYCKSFSTNTPDISLNIIPYFLKRIFTWHNSHYHIDIGTPESFALANRKVVELVPVIEKLGWFPNAEIIK